MKDDSSIEVPRPAGATRGLVALRLGRTVICEARAGDQVKVTRLPGLILRLQADGDAPVVHIDFDYVGVRPTMVDHWWCPVGVDADAAEAEVVGRWSVGPEFADRETKLKRRARRLRDLDRFFLALDRATFVPLLAELGDPVAAEDVEALSGHLFGRMTMRGLCARHGLHLVGVERADRETAAAAERVEARLRPIFAEHVSATGAAIDPQRLWSAMRAFLDGDLFVMAGKRGKKHGGPDGAAFLLFAEMVLYFCELWNGTKRSTRYEFWFPAVRPMVLAAEAYVDIYWTGGPRKSDSYASSPPPRKFGARERDRGATTPGGATTGTPGGPSAPAPDRWGALYASWNGSADVREAGERFAALVAFALRDYLRARPLSGVLIAPGGPKP